MFEWGSSVAFSVISQTIYGGIAPALMPLDDLGKHPLLQTAVVKLRWGHRQLAGLEHNLLDAFSDPVNQAVIRADLDGPSGYHVFSVSSVPAVSEFAEDFTNAVADIAKNFHPALDQLAWQLACDFAPSGRPNDPKGVKFPIVDRPEDWKKAERRSGVQFRPDHWGFMERFQPYRGVDGWADSWQGNYVHPLSFLRDLSDDDKHRISKPVFLMPQQFDFARFRFLDRPDGTKDWVVTGIGQPLELGRELMRARLSDSAAPEINPAGLCRPQVSFSTGDQASAALQRVERFVHLILSEFSRTFQPSVA
jgi:hypothetical protein